MRDDDLEAFAALNADPRVMEHFPAPFSRAESDAAAARIRANVEQHGFGLWAVELPGQESFVGIVGLTRATFDAQFTPCVEVAWRLCAEHWGHGYATEAARASLALGFEQLGLDEILAWTTPGNRASLRVMEKIGMTRDASCDFEHPRVPVGHRLRRHVVYRASSPARR